MSVLLDRTLVMNMPTVLIHKVVITVFVTLVTVAMVSQQRPIQVQSAVMIKMSARIKEIIVMKTLFALINRLAITANAILVMKGRVILM